MLRRNEVSVAMNGGSWNLQNGNVVGMDFDNNQGNFGGGGGILSIFSAPEAVQEV